MTNNSQIIHDRRRMYNMKYRNRVRTFTLDDKSNKFYSLNLCFG